MIMSSGSEKLNPWMTTLASVHGHVIALSCYQLHKHGASDPGAYHDILP